MRAEWARYIGLTILGLDATSRLSELLLVACSSMLVEPEVGAFTTGEQVEAKPLVGRSDIVSLGIVMNEMATGERPAHTPMSTQALNSEVCGEG